MYSRLVSLFVVFASLTAFADTSPVGPCLQMNVTTLELMHQKGLISEAEYQNALKDLNEVGDKAKSESTLLIGKFATTMYGFVEADMIHDSTQSFVDLAGGGAIARPGSNAGDNGRSMFSIRNSRIGFRLGAPEVSGIRTSAQLEMDFLGNQPGTPPNNKSYSESGFFNNPTFRIRHFFLKADTDYVTVLVGQTWELVGWQSQFQPPTVEIQGVPGELYARTMQLRLSHAFHFGPATLDVALAALRPPQMDSQIPDLQAGAKLSFNGWTGVSSSGSTSTSIQPLSVGISGGTRQFKLPSSATADQFQTVNGDIGAVDLLIPVIPAKERRSFALTITAEGASGTGIADLYTGFNGGATVGAPYGLPAGYNYAGVADIDNGLAGWGPSGNLETVSWKSMIVGAQLYLPPSGKVFLTGAYSNTISDNVGDFGAPSGQKTFGHETWWDVCAFADVTNAVRVGLEYASFSQRYGDSVLATNNRLQLSGFFIF